MALSKIVEGGAESSCATEVETETMHNKEGARKGGKRKKRCARDGLELFPNSSQQPLCSRWPWFKHVH